MNSYDLTEAIDAAWDALHDDGHNGLDCRPDRPLDVTAERVLRAALPHLEQQIRDQVAAEQSNLRPDDKRWQTSVAEYRRVGYTDTPDDADRMFWEAGFRQAANAAARIARTRKDTDHA